MNNEKVIDKTESAYAQELLRLFLPLWAMMGVPVSVTAKYFVQAGVTVQQMNHTSRLMIFLCGDILLITLAYVLAYYLRFEIFLFSLEPSTYIAILPALLAVKLPVFYAYGLYRGMWRYTGMSDLRNIVMAVVISSVAIGVVMLLVNQFHGYSRAVFVLDGVFTLFLVGASRVGVRFAFQRSRLDKGQKLPGKKRILLIGAGDAAEKIVRELKNNPTLPYQAVGFVDDDVKKFRRRIHNVTVLGNIDDLAEHAEWSRADELLIAIAAIDAAGMQRLVALCRKTGLPFKVLPGLGELIDGQVSVSAMRDINYTDLLGREQVNLDQEQIGGYVRGKTILVTGAGGSIGSELCRQLLHFQPGLLVLYDSGEENLYKIQMELEHDHAFKNYVTVLGQVQNKQLLSKVFGRYSPEVVFHAAAYKHVPLVEMNPWEAVSNNIVAVKHLIEASVEHGVRRFVLVSTDKAVRPTNVMGASKRATELIMLSYCREEWNRLHGDTEAAQAAEATQPATGPRPCADCDCRDTTFMAVRFGNVLGSSGSVIPLFKQQIEKGGPITVTHPDITRYFMSIQEAAQLILQAGAMGQGGEIFLLKMGAPVKIASLAQDLIKLMGGAANQNIKITYTGLRPGEKLYEELITEGEGIVPTGHKKIMVLRGQGAPRQTVDTLVDELVLRARAYNGPGIKETLQKLIPEYQPDLQAGSVMGLDPASLKSLRN